MVTSVDARNNKYYNSRWYRASPPTAKPEWMSQDEFARMRGVYNSAPKWYYNDNPTNVAPTTSSNVWWYYGPEYARTMGWNLPVSPSPMWEDLIANQYKNNPTTSANVSPYANFQTSWAAGQTWPTTPWTPAPFDYQNILPQQYNQAWQDAASMLWVNIPWKQIAWMDTAWMSANEKKILPAYQQLESMLDENNAKYANIMSFVDKETKDMLKKNREAYLSQYEVIKQKWQEYYWDLWASTAKKMAEEQALAMSQAWRSWATPAAAWVTMSDLASKQLEDMLKVKWAELQQAQTLYDTYKKIEDEFVANYAGSTDKNIVATYKDILNSKNSLASQVTEARRQIQNAEMQHQMAMSQQAAAASAQQKLAEAQNAAMTAEQKAAWDDWYNKQKELWFQWVGLVNPNMWAATRFNPLTNQNEVFYPWMPDYPATPLSNFTELWTWRANANQANPYYTWLNVNDYLFWSWNQFYTGSYWASWWNIPWANIYSGQYYTGWNNTWNATSTPYL